MLFKQNTTMIFNVDSTSIIVSCIVHKLDYSTFVKYKFGIITDKNCSTIFSNITVKFVVSINLKVLVRKIDGGSFIEIKTGIIKITIRIVQRCCTKINYTCTTVIRKITIGNCNSKCILI